MGLKDNKYYWDKSLEKEEEFFQSWYAYDEIIISKGELIEKIERIRSIIKKFCYTSDPKDRDVILSEILNLLKHKDIVYNEFIAFGKTQDISFSLFSKNNR